MDVRIAQVDQAQNRFSYRAFLRWEVGYVLILLLWAHTGEGDTLKQLSNGFALLFVLRIGMYLLARMHRLDRRSRVLLFFVAVFAAANAIVNVGQEQFSENVKIVSIFVFYLAGETTDESFFERTPGFLLVSLFVALPVLSALVALYSGREIGEFNQAALSFFANRNNAVAFTVVTSWTLMLIGARRWLIAGYLVVCVLAFKTMGALVALAVAIYLAYFGFNLLGTVVLGALAAGLYFGLGDNLEILSRVATSWHTLGKVLAESGGIWGLGKMDYAQIYEATGTSDISLIFRLKHWINLLGLYADGSPIHQLFGFGVAASDQMTNERLLPHNDYIRFLFELGPGLLCCFVAVNMMILKRTVARFISVPAIFLCIYFFSDNLINNFLVMSFFYFTAGALVSAKRRLDQRQAVDPAQFS